MSKTIEKDDIIYEAEVIEETDLIPFEAEDEEAGMSNGAAFALGALATAGIIFIGKKAVEGGKKLWSKHQDKKAAAAKAKEEAQEPEAPAPAEEAPATEEA